MPHAIDTEPSAPSIIGSPAPERTNLDLASVDDEYSDNVPFDHGDFDAQTRDRVRNAVCRANRTVMRELGTYMRTVFSTIRDHPSPPGRILVPYVDLLFSSGHAPRLVEARTRLLTATGEIPEVEREYLLQEAEAGLRELNRMIHGGDVASDESDTGSDDGGPGEQTDRETDEGNLEVEEGLSHDHNGIRDGDVTPYTGHRPQGAFERR